MFTDLGSKIYTGKWGDLGMVHMGSILMANGLQFPFLVIAKRRD